MTKLAKDLDTVISLIKKYNMSEEDANIMADTLVSITKEIQNQTEIKVKEVWRLNIEPKNISFNVEI